MAEPVNKLPVTILLAVKNEAVNLPKCLSALQPAERVVLLDSHSEDETAAIAKQFGAELVQFDYAGGYPKKRQWALENVRVDTPWILLLDADEVIPAALWEEIAQTINAAEPSDAYMITKGFHFLGKPMRHGGFSHSAVLLFKTGKAHFERIFDDDLGSLDMEVHERVLVNGRVGVIKTPLIHEDFKGLEAYIARHNKYSSWEAQLRKRYLDTGTYGQETIAPRLLGNSQERRRALKSLIIRLPFEHWLWFGYHYVFRMAFLEGRRGLIACQIRASYIAQVRAKIFELGLRDSA
ncbi:glycosyltransferase family 2 protein [Pseudomonas sp. N040]|uniref:glycosyltransferase family 2 protein n=1 Tax=Pseudomonas sp. N040 TaxID=2785325 RepID=UPI0018A2816C|nr:glycosyltransferase family 2 protein [Pseudomonas sp. N040]MBF7730496.1 glycosyltransferase family 2 protein [Pseudomonas sp. N040]MBW7014140.1 glycosyltransferase family 2 protein [Pseudomonas sp. N040]